MKVTKTYFMVMVADMDRATRFYTEVFGLTVRFPSPEWTELSFGDATIALHGGRTADPRDTTGANEASLGFEVDDVEAACAAVQAAGGHVVKAPEDRPGESIRLATVADTEGNLLSVAEPSWTS